MKVYYVNMFKVPVEHKKAPGCNAPGMFWRFSDGGYSKDVWRCRCGQIVDLTTGFAAGDVYWYWAEVESTDEPIRDFKKRRWHA